ncbi:MAG: ABC transporter ATP-binding protein [Oscillospiraceae bacterium]|nr:ABC transporter ATP-binding protein [Oscillospiraceae bacterium]
MEKQNRVIRPLAGYLRPFLWKCIAGPFFKLLEAILELYMPLRLAGVIDKVLELRDAGEPYSEYVLREGAILVGIVALGLCSAILCQYWASQVSQGYGTKLRSVLYRKMQSLSHRELDAFGTPSLVNRLTADVNALQNAVAMLIRLVIRAPFLCIGGIIMAFTLNAQLALVILIAVPLLVLAMVLVTRKSVPLHTETQKKNDRLAVILRENLSGVRVIRAFTRTEEQRERYGNAADESMHAAIRANRVGILLNPLTQLIMNLAIVLILAVSGVRFPKYGDISSGDLIALINYVNQILAALVVVSNLVVLYAKAYASGKRVCEVLHTEPELRSGEVTEGVSGAPAVCFRSVSFSYHEKNVLENISFTVERGMTVGIIGGTGSGKSTLTHLISRLYDCTAGEVEVDGVNVRAYTLEALRKKIAVVPQEVQLFSGTIRENIVLGNPQATQEELERAAKIAQADAFIREKENGYQGTVARGGRNFSGGQRQRLAIARAIASGSEILIFDDATSALDYATDAAVRKGLREELNDVTLFMISQRVSAVRHADLILVLDDGHLAGAGRHEALYASCEAYREICRSQNVKGKEGSDV